MTKQNKHQGENLFKAVMMTHFILFLHLLIIIGIVLMVIFFQGIARHFWWILLAVTLVLLLTAFIIFRRIKADGKKMLHDLENSSVYRERGFEVSILRGLVSLKLGQPDALKKIEDGSTPTTLQLEDPETIRIRDLTELARMYEKNLITAEEYDRAKNKIMKSI